jgi:phage terminase small subunit
MTAAPAKRPRVRNRDVAPLEPVDARLGPKMLVLSEKQQKFVIALFTTVRPGHGAASKAARCAGFGTPTSTPQSIATISSRLMNDERVLEGMREYGERFIRSTAPAAIRAMHKLILTPSHKDHGRAVGMLLDRVHPAETTHKVTVEHQASSSMKATAEVFERIMQLAARAKVPPMINVTPEKAAS